MLNANQTEGQRAHRSIAEGRLTPVLSSRAREWDPVTVDLFRMRRGDMIAPLREHVVWVQLRGSTTCLWPHDGQVLHRTTHPGDITIAPAGNRTAWHHEGEKEAEIVALCIAPSFLAKIVNETSPEQRVQLLPHFAARDALIEDLATRLLGELLSEGYAGRFLVESAAALLCVHLLRSYSSAAASALPAPTALPRHKLRLATDYINDNLRSDLTVDAIARHVLMGRFRFAHLFKESMGVAPHQYVTKLRIERAKSLLRETKLPVTAIGSQVGFASPSHFSMVFRKYTGSTPCRYRTIES